MSGEGSLQAPKRHPIAWREDEFYNFDSIHAEMERVFDICHGCRRCFNLCDSFPQLFDMVDEGPTGEVDGLKPEDFKPVVDACTLCDMCFMTKCPYVPPHEFDLDFPHLMLRYRAAETRRDGPPKVERQLAQTDRNGKLAQPVAPIANLFSSKTNTFSRGVLESVAGIDAKVDLPKYHTHTFAVQARQDDRVRDVGAPAANRKAVIYSTCVVEFNNPSTGMAAKAVLEANGVLTEIAYPGCCGMPFLEHGDIGKVASQAAKVAKALRPWVDKGYDVIAPTASCGLMLKFEWPLIEPDNEDVRLLAAATKDICQYVVDIAKREGLAVQPQPVAGGVTAHLACHARAQNLGQKSAEMLRLIPDTKVDVIERCSGHGGTFGVMKTTRPLAQKVGRNAVNAAKRAGNANICSDCPLACKHISQELEIAGAPAPKPQHPIEIFAAACGLV